MAKASKTRASKQNYVSQSQYKLVGFETPFSQKLNPTNRWVILADRIPWDILVNVYNDQLNNKKTGADGINARVAIGAVIIKQYCDLSDRETVQQIQENMYMQYFIGYSSFSDEPPFDPSLFVDFRKRLGVLEIEKINSLILGLNAISHINSTAVESAENQSANNDTPDAGEPTTDSTNNETPDLGRPSSEPENEIITHFGDMICDATACPQDIAYPTDLNLLNDAREKSELLIDAIYDKKLHTKKPRTDRPKARKEYLQTAQKKVKTKKNIHKANKKQLAYLKRNILAIHRMLDKYDKIPLNKIQYKYLLVIQCLYAQQQKMFADGTQSIEHRIVSIHQPHVRPIVRGKANAKTEFGAKINVTMMNGFAFLDDLEWDAYNEGTRLLSSVEKYKERFGFYPKRVMVDKIYCNKANRAALKLLKITLRAKPLGRPKAMDEKHVSPGERNPIEGKFGQGKTRYGLGRIGARLQSTSQSWIASTILVLNLVKLAGQALLCQIKTIDFYQKQINVYKLQNPSSLQLLVA